PMGLKVGLGFDGSQRRQAAGEAMTKRNAFMVPLAYNFGSHTAYLTLVKVGKLSGPNAAQPTDSTDATAFALGWEYALSKLTTFGAFYAKIDNKANANYNFFSLSANGATPATAGENVAQRYIFEEECGYVGTPPLIPFGLTMCAAVLLRFGTEAQKKRFLPRIYKGDDFWCQGYSEPGSGSDLASLKTKAARHEDHYVVNGQKTWTTLAHYADWIFCLVRTDPNAEKRQEGISFLLIDMKTPGISVRPLILMDGEHEVNEVFFDDVKVPVENRVHEEGKGWTVAKYLLGHERLTTGRIGASKRELAKLKEIASKQMKDGRPLMRDARFRDKVSRLEVELTALEITNLRFLDQLRGGRVPGPE